jgi:hypothetical protein
MNRLSLSENALKLTYGNVEFQYFLGEDTRAPCFKRKEGEGGEVEEGRGVGRGGGGGKWVGEVRREGVERKG